MVVHLYSALSASEIRSAMFSKLRQGKEENNVASFHQIGTETGKTLSLKFFCAPGNLAK